MAWPGGTGGSAVKASFPIIDPLIRQGYHCDLGSALLPEELASLWGKVTFHIKPRFGTNRGERACTAEITEKYIFSVFPTACIAASEPAPDFDPRVSSYSLAA
jgi:hypothetical protein